MRASRHSCARTSGRMRLASREAGAVVDSLREDSQPLPLNLQMEHPWGTDFIECPCGARMAFVFDVDANPRLRVVRCEDCDCVHYQMRPRPAVQRDEGGVARYAPTGGGVGGGDERSASASRRAADDDGGGAQGGDPRTAAVVPAAAGGAGGAAAPGCGAAQAPAR